MAKFPIERARERLGVIPTTAVRANIDVSTGGQELGQAVSEFGGAISNVVLKIEMKRREMMDANSSVQAQKLRDLADEEYEQYKLTNPQETWQGFRQKQTEGVAANIGKLNFSPNTLAIEAAKAKVYSETSTARALTDATRKLKTDTIKIQAEALTAAFRSNNPEKIGEAIKRYTATMSGIGMNKVIILNNIKAAKEAGDKLLSQDLVDNIYAAIEVASDPVTGGNFDIAKELAKNPSIPEPKQATLRSAIGTAENVRTSKAKEERQRLIDKTTSDTIREYFNKELTVAELDKRHERGLVRDSEYKIMKKGLSVTAPEHSNAFAAGRVRRAKTDFDMGAITRVEADKVVLENYPQLDEEAREKVFADLEDIEENIIAASKSNAYNEGVGLMSVEFVGITSDEDFLNKFLGITGLTDEDRDRINRRWEAEKSNRNLYERAVDDRFKEMRKENISDVDRFTSESLKIYLQYQKRKRLTLEELETQVRKEQQQIISGEFGRRPDGTQKGTGFLGVLKLGGKLTGTDAIATEYSVDVKLESRDGKETNIPSLVPTLTQKEIDLMVNDIIPNNKSVPSKILQKAVDHANKRVREGKSPFAQAGEQRVNIATIKPVSKMTTAEKQRELERIRGLKTLAR